MIQITYNDDAFLWPALYDAEMGEEAEEVGKDWLHRKHLKM